LATIERKLFVGWGLRIVRGGIFPGIFLALFFLEGLSYIAEQVLAPL
jgi:hypothetical protein